ncbi:MAG: GNAT family N-acetyltransferase [Anaeromicrobium sp.]|jgi:ribosomal-protein-alanine N-acetyltransferase|uniref:GNAT family N-acetyltransferase n=1 Tax=Anaeromicrobium sp. TaxID=1929132 RepID=UPI0025EADA81|nr:GNAT family protein [Anaeromicrobium sp.]MCT4593919.1 GNAT family N-acetyltransferase [Anaeromicrobium sp.]
MYKVIYLETDRLIIRDHKIADLKTHHLLLSDDTAMYYLQDIKTNSLEDAKKNLTEAIEQIPLEKREKYFFRIEYKVTKEHIGEIGYTVEEFSPVGKFIELGYFTYKKHWNKGYMTEAVKEVMRFDFEENNVFRIYTGCIKDNIGSERVMQKCGMIKEADFKMKTWHYGKTKDRVAYRLLKDEWIKNKF